MYDSDNQFKMSALPNERAQVDVAPRVTGKHKGVNTTITKSVATIKVTNWQYIGSPRQLVSHPRLLDVVEAVTKPHMLLHGAGIGSACSSVSRHDDSVGDRC